MGKGSNGNLISAVEKFRLQRPSDSAMKNLISWEEVAKHNTKNDCWIVVNNIVYNMSNFRKKHPGGSKILEFYAGQDATEVFNAFHKDFDRVAKYSKTYQIGLIDPSGSLNDRSDQEKEKAQKELEIREDFRKIQQIALEKGYFKPSYTFFFLHSIQIVFFYLMGFYIQIKYGGGWIPTLCALACSVMAQAQASWTQHDHGHSSLLWNPKHNRYIHMFFMGTIKGASADWWAFMHNLHHAKPNVIDKDPDCRLEPMFVVGDTNPRRRAEQNVKENAKNPYPYTIQQFLFPIGAFLLFPAFFQITTFRHIFRKKKYIDLVSMAPMYMLYFGCGYYAFGSIWKSLAYFFASRLLESAWFTWVSQCNHIVMDVHDDVDYESWFHLQLRATCNIEQSWFNDWFTGHLNFQIEHHLFPTMPRHNLYKIQPYVQSMCKKHNIKYVNKQLGEAFYDILTSLKKSGQLWQEAYDELKMSL
uniref:Delta-5 desaturase 1 n=1 Tax=Brachionus koreanus TaxID=1199090 RepID=A0A291LM75_9BILA|nr:delta-5 desaturase 1 [Brachionus koreanus]QBO56256.1 fatty acid desaturase 5/6-5 [Brachionus koreanus]